MAEDLAVVHRIASEGLAAKVQRIGDDQWGLPTPNTEWNVRDLVQHLTYGASWVAPLLHGETLAEVGDRYEGDLLGDDPKDSFRLASEAAVAACLEPEAMQRTVHTSQGPIPAEDYLLQRIADLGMHTWDLSRAIGADETLNPRVVAVGRRLLAEHGEQWRAGGALAAAVPVGAEADDQTRFIAESGRDPNWTPA